MFFRYYETGFPYCASRPFRALVAPLQSQCLIEFEEQMNATILIESFSGVKDINIHSFLCRLYLYEPPSIAQETQTQSYQSVNHELTPTRAKVVSNARSKQKQTHKAKSAAGTSTPHNPHPFPHVMQIKSTVDTAKARYVSKVPSTIQEARAAEQREVR